LAQTENAGRRIAEMTVFAALLIANSHGRLAHAHLHNRIFPTEKAPTTTQASSEIKLQR
jgi:hypothetical protein